VIQVVDLHKRIGGRPVLGGVSLTVPDGTLAVLIGRSGAGKSVLLRHLMGLMVPDAGAVLVDGVDLARLPRAALDRVRARFGVLFQGGALFDFMTVLENVAFPLRERGLGERQARQRATAQLAAVELADALDKYPLELSGGMRKRAALARALVGAPAVALFDEPTTGLDPVLLGAIHQLIADAHAQLGFTGVVVSHEVPEIFAIADQVAMLEDGVIVEAGSPAQLLGSTNPIVRRFLLGGGGPRLPRTGGEPTSGGAPARGGP
jgi:phospholipid/cholesterol/gamma-HCH transport system ATP-binding protein